MNTMLFNKSYCPHDKYRKYYIKYSDTAAIQPITPIMASHSTNGSDQILGRSTPKKSFLTSDFRIKAGNMMRAAKANATKTANRMKISGRRCRGSSSELSPNSSIVASPP